MKTGICTTDLPVMPAEELFAKLERYGIETVQFHFGSATESGFSPDNALEIPAAIDAELVALVRRCAERHRVAIKAVNGIFNMAHPDASVRQEGLRRLEGLARAVSGLGCGYITLCSGTRNTLSPWDGHPDNGSAQAWDDMMQTVSAAGRMAERFGLVLAVETEAGNIVDTPEKARLMMDTAGSPNLKMIMDCANLFHPGQARREKVRDILRHAFELFGPDVVIAHGKDIQEGDGIEFCATGEGIIDYPYFIQLLREYRYTGDMFLHSIYDEAKLPGALRYISGLSEP